jgi:hypothetical protein
VRLVVGDEHVTRRGSQTLYQCGDVLAVATKLIQQLADIGAWLHEHE